MKLKQKEKGKDWRHIRKLFRMNARIKCLLTLDLKSFTS